MSTALEVKLPHGVTFERPVAQISEQDITNMFEKLRQQRASWQVVEVGGAEKGDRVIIDYKGTIDGMPFTGNSGTSVRLELGKGTMIDGFEEQLIGATTEEHRTLKLKFPEVYFDREVAGKDVIFEVQLKSVSRLQLPPLDDEFASTFGIEGGMKQFEDKIRSTLEFTLDQAIQGKIRSQILDALIDANNKGLDVPEELINNALASIKQEANEAGDDMITGTDVPDSLLIERARKQATLGLLLPEIISKYSILADSHQIQQKLERLSESYEVPAEFIQTYQNDPSLMRNIEAMVLEEKVVDFLQEKMLAKDIPTDFDTVINAI